MHYSPRSPKNKYILYVRRSQDSEDRQVESTKDQVNECKKIAERLGLDIVETIEESKSALKPGRTGFNTMLERIYSGEVDGILCWNLDRLARNPIDGGQIIWMLQQKIIQHIRTNDSDHLPTDNMLLLHLKFGMANQFSLDLGNNVRRGVLSKAERGWCPHANLPLGYIHNPRLHVPGFNHGVEDEIVPNPDSFLIIKRLWRKLLKNNYTIADCYREAQDQNLLSSRTQRPISKSMLYNLFTNDFYCGYFWQNNKEGVKQRFIGKHKKMISEKEFDRVQMLLGKRNKPNTVFKTTHIFFLHFPLEKQVCKCD